MRGGGFGGEGGRGGEEGGVLACVHGHRGVATHLVSPGYLALPLANITPRSSCQVVLEKKMEWCAWDAESLEREVQFLRSITVRSSGSGMRSWRVSAALPTFPPFVKVGSARRVGRPRGPDSVNGRPVVRGGVPTPAFFLRGSSASRVARNRPPPARRSLRRWVGHTVRSARPAAARGDAPSLVAAPAVAQYPGGGRHKPLLAARARPAPREGGGRRRGAPLQRPNPTHC